VAATPPAAAIRYVYDDSGRLKAVADPANGAAIFKWDPVGNLIAVARPAISQVAILGFHPETAAAGDALTIEGTNFGATAAQNTVKFGTTAATVTSATTTQLVVVVPSGLTGPVPISVTAPGGSATSDGSFTPAAATAAPSVSTVSSLLPSSGTSLTINGSGFEPHAGSNTVRINQNFATVTAATSTSLSVTVPYATYSGRLKVRTPKGSATGPDLFIPPIGYVASQIGTTGRMAVGDTKSVSIATADKIALIGFDGKAGQRVSLLGTDDTIGTYDEISIRNPDGTVAERVPCCSPIWSRTLELGQTGTFTILVDPASSQTGSVTLNLYDASSMFATLPAATTAGVSADIATTSPGQYAIFKFPGTQGETVWMDLVKADAYSGFVTLIAPDGSFVYSSPVDANSPFGSPVTLSQTGTYQVNTNITGPYTTTFSLKLWRDPPDPAPDVTTSMTIGSTKKVTITTPFQKVVVSFAGTNGQRVALLGTADSIEAYDEIKIRDPGGNVINTLSCCNPIWSRTLELQQSGTFTITADPSAGRVGSLTLNLYDASTQTATLPAATTSGVSATIATTSPGQYAVFSFPATQGERVWLELAKADPYTGFATLVPPNGPPYPYSAEIADGTSFDSPLTLAQTGTYKISTNITGPYTTTFTARLWELAPDISDTISVGGTKTLTFTTPSQNATITFSGTTGQRIALLGTNDTVGAYDDISIRNPNGTVAKTLPCCTEIWSRTLELGQSGTYTINVDPSGARTGSLTLNLYDATTQTATLPAATTSGVSAQITTTSPGQYAAFYFPGTQGQTISLSVTKQHSYTGDIALIAPSGAILYNAGITTSTTFGGDRTLTESGTYKINTNLDGPYTETYTATLRDVGSGGGFAPLVGLSLSDAEASSSTQRQAARLPKARAAGCPASVTHLRRGAARTGLRLLLDGASRGDLAGALCDARAARTKSRRGARRIRGMHLKQRYERRSRACARPPKRPNRARSRARKLCQRGRSEPRGPSTRPRTLLPRRVRDYRPSSPPQWRPAGTGLRRWRTGREKSPWASLPARAASEGETALSGQALTLDGLPLRGATLEIDDAGVSATTDGTGRFLLRNVPSGQQVLVIDGTTADHDGLHFGRFESGVDIDSGETNDLPYTIWMPILDTVHEVPVSSPTSKALTITTPSIPGFEIRIPAGSSITDEDGEAVDHIGITPIPVDRPPFPLPKDVRIPIYFTAQPGGAYLSKGAQIVYPNYTGVAPRTRADFWQYDPEDRGWYVYGQGTVAADGKQVVPDAGVRVWEFTGAMFTPPSMGNGDPSSGGPANGDKAAGGEPVDLGTGLFTYQKTDLYLDDVIPIGVTRVYQQRDAERTDAPLRSFGYAMSMDTYDWRLNSADTSTYSQADLVLGDGSYIHYLRTSPGTDYQSAVFAASATAGPFFKSTIKWNGSYRGWDLRMRAGTVLHFGEAAGLQWIADRFGNRVNIARENNLPGGRVVQVTSPGGRWIRFTYGDPSCGLLSQARDNAGRTVSYHYTGCRLDQVTTPTGGKITYAYNAAGQIWKIASPNAYSLNPSAPAPFLTNSYANGRVVDQTTADSGSNFHFDYVVANGKVSQTTLTTKRSAVAGDQTVRVVTFNSDGYPVSDTIGTGTEQETTVYEREAGTGRLTSVTDGRGIKTTFGYDGLGNVNVVKRLDNTSNPVITNLVYEPAFSQLESITDPLNHTTTFGYGTQGELKTITDANLHPTTLDYDNGGGLPTKIHDALDHTTELTYDGSDLIAIKDPDGFVTRRFVDAAGRVTQVTDPRGVATRLSYDDEDRLTSVIAPSRQTQLGYDLDGNLTSVQDARGGRWTANYDAMDRVKDTTDALGNLAPPVSGHTELYTYDLAGNPSSYTDRKGQKTIYSYDSVGRPKQVGFGATVKNGNTTYKSTINYGFDEADRLTSAVDSLISGSFTLGYDDLNRLMSAVQPGKGKVTYTYDDADRLRTTSAFHGTVSSPDQVLTYDYDPADRVSQIARAAAGAMPAASVLFAYDDADRPQKATLPNGVEERYSFDPASRLTQIAYWKGLQQLGDLSYDYDEAGHRTAVWGSYARTGLPAAFAQGARIFNQNNQLTSQGSTTYSYDNNGNLTSGGSSTFTWDERNQLATIATPRNRGGSPNASFAYDPFGRRVQKTVNGTTTAYVYDSENAVQELTSAGAVQANLLTGPGIDETFERWSPSLTSDLLTDALGSTVATTDPLGGAQTSYTYDPFGATTSSGATNANSFQFTGRENDQDGLYYYRARYYSPGMQRFVSEDPIGFAGGDPNFYGYAGGDPVDFGDPSGLWFGEHVASILPTPAKVGNALGDATGWAGNAIGSLDNPVSQAAAGALNGAFFGLPGKPFGFNGACAGGAYGFGDDWLSWFVPLGAVGKAGKAAEGAGWLGTKMAAATYGDIARQYVRNAIRRVRDAYQRAGWRIPERVVRELEAASRMQQRHGTAIQEAVKWMLRRFGKM
jgi:RHS repeat-associated protein